jgi:hypothetical protein
VYSHNLSHFPVALYHHFMSKTKGLGQGFRSDKAPKSDAASLLTAAPVQPGSAEVIAETLAKLGALDRGAFKAAQDYATASENLRDALKTHREIQTEQAKAEATARLDQVPALEAIVATLTGEALASKETIRDLNAEIDRLRPRVASANLWDEQVSRLATEAKAEEDRIAAEEKQAKEQKWREDFLTKYQARVAEDVINEKNEQSDFAAHAADARGTYEQWGPRGGGLWTRHQAELTKRATNLRFLAYAQRMMAEPDFTREQAKALEDSFRDAADRSARQGAGREMTRQHLDGTREFDPSFDYVPPPVQPDRPVRPVAPKARIARDVNGNFLYEY